MKKLKGKITISRTHSSDGDFIHIMIADELSGTQFFDGKMEMADFASAITGHGYIPIEFTPRGLEYVGSRCETKELVFLVPERGEKEYAEKNYKKFVEEGWIGDGYFRSQSSIRRHEDGHYYAHGYQRRYVKE